MTAGLVPEVELAARGAGGDEQAFRALWDTAHRRAYGLCYRMTGNEADAWDALADTQLAAWRNLGRFEGRSPFVLWVLAIARNAALALIRSRAPEIDLGTLDDRPVAGAGHAENIVDAMTVRAALDRVQPHQREALLLWASGLSYAEIGALQGAEIGTVRVRVHRARVALRVALNAHH